MRNRLGHGWSHASGLSITALAFLLLLSACAANRLEPVPSALEHEATPLGLTGLRAYPEPSLTLAAPAAWPTRVQRVDGPGTIVADEPRDLLAISAGGDGGAFAVGIITGWTEAGTRPRFAEVTGVSVGALIAPFAFLGPRYDYVLRDVALSTQPGTFFRKRNVLAGILSDGFASSAPMQHLISTHVTPEVMREIAEQYAEGRNLFIMTTDLDAGRPVIWNMGAIAASGSPGALALFRQVMLASASIPAAVSPVLMDVTAGGHHFQELHVDGSVSHELFLLPDDGAPLPRVSEGSWQRPARAFIIVNNRLDMKPARTPRSTLKIGARALSTMVQLQANNDLEKIFTSLQRQGIEFNLAYIDESFDAPHPREFDPSYMHQLYAYGERLAVSGTAWHTAPPQMPDGDAVEAPKPVSAALHSGVGQSPRASRLHLPQERTSQQIAR